MSNEETIQQLIYRVNRIDGLIPLQKDEDLKSLLRAERAYVDELRRYRQNHGDPKPVLK